MKSELEEAAERLWNDPSKQLTSKKSFIEGAKWQAERMFSEEDMKHFALWLIKVNFNHTSNVSDIFLVWKQLFKK